MVVFFIQQLCVSVYVIAIALTICTLSQPVTYNSLKNFKARVYCYLSSFLFDNCGFLLFVDFCCLQD